MPDIPGTIVGAKVTTGHTSNEYPVADQNEIAGGLHSVATLADRDAIYTPRLKVGMECYVSATDTKYRWNGSIWVEASIGGSVPRFIEVVVQSISKSVVTGAGSIGFFAPSEFNGTTIEKLYISVNEAGTGDCTFQFSRSRAGSRSDILATPMTLPSGDFYAESTTIDDASIQTGDRFYCDVETVGATAPKGLIFGIKVTV